MGKTRQYQNNFDSGFIDFESLSDDELDSQFNGNHQVISDNVRPVDNKKASKRRRNEPVDKKKPNRRGPLN